MPFPFGKSHKSPADIVKNLKDNMAVLEKHDLSDKKAEKVPSSILLSPIPLPPSLSLSPLPFLSTPLSLVPLYSSLLLSYLRTLTPSPSLLPLLSLLLPLIW